MSMFIGNLELLALNLPLIPYIAKVLSIPHNFLIPVILFFTLVGGSMENNFARSMQLYEGVSFIWERPITLGLLTIAVGY